MFSECYVNVMPMFGKCTLTHYRPVLVLPYQEIPPPYYGAVYDLVQYTAYFVVHYILV